MMAEEPGQSALDHLQQAAIQLIAAARAALDTLDSVVATPPRPGDILGRFGPLAESILTWVGGAAGSPGQDDGRPADPAPHGRYTPVERIPVQ